jgi:hypothetical protein
LFSEVDVCLGSDVRGKQGLAFGSHRIPHRPIGSIGVPDWI